MYVIYIYTLGCSYDLFTSAAITLYTAGLLACPGKLGNPGRDTAPGAALERERPLPNLIASISIKFTVALQAMFYIMANNITIPNIQSLA